MTIISNPLLLESLMRKAPEPESWERVPLQNESSRFEMGRGDFGQPTVNPAVAWSDNLLRFTPVTFVGRNAQTADHAALERAEEMESKGLPRDRVLSSTGWLRLADGKPRFEVSDHDATLNPGGNTIGELLNHPRLFKAHPDLAKIQVRIVAGMSGASARYIRPYRDEPETIEISAALDPEERLKAVVHELGHAVQYREGFAPGGSVNLMQYFIDRDRAVGPARQRNAEAAYRELAGEEEATLTERRLKMSPAQRLERPPWLDQEVPDERQIILDSDTFEPLYPLRIPSPMPPIFFD
jgi:hypothetical protein